MQTIVSHRSDDMRIGGKPLCGPLVQEPENTERLGQRHGEWHLQVLPNAGMQVHHSFASTIKGPGQSVSNVRSGGNTDPKILSEQDVYETCSSRRSDWHQGAEIGAMKSKWEREPYCRYRAVCSDVMVCSAAAYAG